MEYVDRDRYITFVLGAKLYLLIACCIMACEITDYELQVGITEMMFRLSNRENRASLGRAWFTDELYLDAFLRVKDADFETVCSF